MKAVTASAASPADLATRIAARSSRGDWFVYLLGDEMDCLEKSRELASAMEAFVNTSGEVVDVSAGADVLVSTLPERSVPVIIVGADSWSSEEWHKLDGLRSRLQRSERTVLLLKQPALESLVRYAPNLASWIGGSTWRHTSSPHLSTEEREQRLQALRAWAGATDEEVLARASAGTLPRDPEYAEWIVLLGRGDLLER